MSGNTDDPGEIDRRLAELDRQEADLDRQEAEFDQQNRASRRALLEVGLQIDQLRRDEAGIAARTEALQRLDEAEVKARSARRASRLRRRFDQLDGTP